uniref:VQ domain-containing protein n=1 Tax=Kalanchoe fedtschenkoi TaxID=63787 RepID=A0A7N0REI4_KALFE
MEMEMEMEMESSPRAETKLNPSSFLPSPNSSSSSSSSSSNAPITTARSDQNNHSTSDHHPTTFVQADTASFKQVVQTLTGTSDTAKLAHHKHVEFSAARRQQQKQRFKLFERRNSNGFKISPLSSGFGPNRYGSSPRRPDVILSPSVLDFPSLVLSPVTPLMPDPFLKAPNAPAGSGLAAASGGLDVEAEERAIAAEGFYLHSSSPRESEPKLLPLFPLTSPRLPGSSST